jgi:tetratricopeptide (TPR) repeat protein
VLASLLWLAVGLLWGCRSGPDPALGRRAAELYQQGRFDQALPLFLQLAEAQPGEPRLWDNVAACFARLEDWEGGRRAFEQPLEGGGAAETARLGHLGYFQFKTGRYNSALDNLKAALAADPSNPRTRLAYLRCLTVAGRFEQRLEAAQRATKLIPDDPRMWVELALALRDAGREAGAVAALDRALASGRAPGSAYRFRGVLALKNGELDAALADLQRAVELNPDDRDSWYQLANVLYRLGRTDAAERAMLRSRNGR